MKDPGSATIEDFDKLDIRVAPAILEAAPLDTVARKPAYRLVIDFGGGEDAAVVGAAVSTYPDPSRFGRPIGRGRRQFPAAPSRRLAQRRAGLGRFA